MKKMSTRMLVEAGVLIALAQVLSYLKVYEAPYGGAVTAGSMIPVILFAVRWGMKPGLLAGTVFGALQFILGPKYSFHPLSILLDYIVAFGCLGFAGINRKSITGIVTGIFVAVLGRFAAHLISGAIIFGSFAPEGMNPWLYSFLYNGSFLGLELVIAIIIALILYKPLKKFISE